MENNLLFTDFSKNVYSGEYVMKQLRNIGADSCEILFVHTDLLFGQPNLALGRKGYLQALYQIFLDLGVPTLVFPAFSYSFPNREVYDVRKSRTSMGALNEYIRKQPNVLRSLDPLLSIIAIGKQAEFLTSGGPGHHSFGPDSAFEKLHHANGVKFLFFGADFSQHFTYVHYIEKLLQVPYRFDMSFSGIIIDYNGSMFQHTHTIHTQCGGVKLKDFSHLKSELSAKGVLKTDKLGEGEMCCISEKDIFNFVVQSIRENPYSFVEPYTLRDLTREYVYGKNGERVTHC